MIIQESYYSLVQLTKKQKHNWKYKITTRYDFGAFSFWWLSLLIALEIVQLRIKVEWFYVYHVNIFHRYFFPNRYNYIMQSHVKPLHQKVADTVEKLDNVAEKLAGMDKKLSVSFSLLKYTIVFIKQHSFHRAEVLARLGQSLWTTTPNNL